MQWSEVLDELERGADESERYFLDGSIGSTASAGSTGSAGSAGDGPPSLTDVATLLEAAPDLGPLPEELASRARAVLRRIDTVNARLARIPKPTQDAGRTHFAGAASTRPTRFDHTL